MQNQLHIIYIENFSPTCHLTQFYFLQAFNVKVVLIFIQLKGSCFFFFFSISYCINLLRLHNKIAQTGLFQKQKFIFS